MKKIELTREESEKILDDFKRIADVLSILKAQDELCKNEVCKKSIKLVVDEADVLYKDIKGVLYGSRRKV